MKPITGGYRLSLSKTQTEFNEPSSSSTLTFPLQFLHLFTTIIHPTSISLFPPVPPAHPSASRAQFFILNPLLCLHLFLSLHPKQQTFQKEGHQSSSMRPECERVPRLQQITIFPYPHSTLDNIKKKRMGRQRGRDSGERVKETILDSGRTH